MGTRESRQKRGSRTPAELEVDENLTTSGAHSGIGLALVAAVKGYKTIITLPEKMSPEKVAVLRALNATIIRTPTEAAFDSPESHIGVARRLEKEIPNSHILDQYGNPDNPLAHELGTAEEIWEQTGGKVDVVVAGAGTGGTITGLARGLRKHKKNVKIIAADPKGSILAVPESLNEDGADQPYKVEGIGYDFVPDVLDQHAVDTWYKTEDRESFHYSRRLIAEEGLLVGGSSGSAMAAMVRGAKELNLGKDDTMVVILPDSIRSYLSKFVDDDWLAANDLLPPTPPATSPPSPSLEAKKDRTYSNDAFRGTKVRALRLKPVSTVTADSPCASAIETMREKGFDQLPVLASSTSRRLVGLVTLGNLLSRISHGRATGKSPVSEVMFNFTKIPEVVTNPHDISGREQAQHQEHEKGVNGHVDADANNGDKAPVWHQGKKKFIEITMDTPLGALNRFFEWQSAAIVTERDGDKGAMKPVAVVTKVDMLTWLLAQKKMA